MGNYKTDTRPNVYTLEREKDDAQDSGVTECQTTTCLLKDSYYTHAHTFHSVFPNEQLFNFTNTFQVVLRSLVLLLHARPLLFLLLFP